MLKIFESTDFVSLSPNYTSIIRILDEHSKMFFSHFINHNHPLHSNFSKGIGLVCSSDWVLTHNKQFIYYNLIQDNGCPVCKFNSELEDQSLRIKVGIQYATNVLDLSEVKTCLKCNNVNYPINNFFPKTCLSCGELLQSDAQPLFKIKILCKGQKVFDQLNKFVELYGDIRYYNIKIKQRGKDLDTTTICLPEVKSKLNIVKVLGTNWKNDLYDIENYSSPLPADIADKILRGSDYFEIMREEIARGR